MAGKEIQAAIYEALRKFFDQEQVVTEWNMRRGTSDVFQDLASYAPRLDIAIGPFNVTSKNRDIDADRILTFEHPLVEHLKHIVRVQNHGSIYQQTNPRCLIAIEVEHRTSSKHILGGITNASMLGMLGVVVGSSQYIAKVRRIHDYACRLKQVEKAHDDMFGNVACFEETEFLRFLRFVRKRPRGQSGGVRSDGHS